MDKQIIEAPKFAPHQWVMFKEGGDDAAFGKIVSGTYSTYESEASWSYWVQMRFEDERHVDEADIFAVLHDAKWHDVGHGKATKET